MKALEEKGHLVAVKGETDWALDAAALTATSYREVGPALHFQKVKGYPKGFTMAGGLFTGPGNLYLEKINYWTRLCIAMGLGPHASYPQFLRTCTERLAHPIFPMESDTGPVKEVIKKSGEVDVTALPIPLLHEADGGRYGTLQTMIVQDLDSDWVVWENVRTMVIDKTRLVGHFPEHSHIAEIYKKYKALKRPMPFCLVLGAPPMVTATSFLPLPKGVSPAAMAGGLNLDPIELVRAETNGLLVPSQAEVVMEGEVSPTETHSEGPFPDYWIYKTEEGSPVFHVTAMTHRKDPIIPFSVDGVKPSDTHILQSLMLAYELYNRFANVRNFHTQWIQLPIEFNFNVVLICAPIFFPGYVAWMSKYAMSQSKPLGSLWNKVVVVDEKTSSVSLEEMIAIMVQRTNPITGYHFWPGSPIGPNARYASAEQRKRGFASGMYVDTAWPMDWTKDDIPRRCNIEGSFPKEMIDWVVANYNKWGFKGKPVVFEEAIIPF
jgi:4-hydroxy-3-polyprenylbenzoate decarboxylase